MVNLDRGDNSDIYSPEDFLFDGSNECPSRPENESFSTHTGPTSAENIRCITYSFCSSIYLDDTHADSDTARVHVPDPVVNGKSAGTGRKTARLVPALKGRCMSKLAETKRSEAWVRDWSHTCQVQEANQAFAWLFEIKLKILWKGSISKENMINSDHYACCIDVSGIALLTTQFNMISDIGAIAGCSLISRYWTWRISL